MKPLSLAGVALVVLAAGCADEFRDDERIDVTVTHVQITDDDQGAVDLYYPVKLGLGLRFAEDYDGPEMLNVEVGFVPDGVHQHDGDDDAHACRLGYLEVPVEKGEEQVYAETFVIRGEDCPEGWWEQPQYLYVKLTPASLLAEEHPDYSTYRYFTAANAGESPNDECVDDAGATGCATAYTIRKGDGVGAPVLSDLDLSSSVGILWPQDQTTHTYHPPLVRAHSTVNVFGAPPSEMSAEEVIDNLRLRYYLTSTRLGVVLPLTVGSPEHHKHSGHLATARLRNVPHGDGELLSSHGLYVEGDAYAEIVTGALRSEMEFHVTACIESDSKTDALPQGREFSACASVPVIVADPRSETAPAGALGCPGKTTLSGYSFDVGDDDYLEATFWFGPNVYLTPSCTVKKKFSSYQEPSRATLQTYAAVGLGGDWMKYQEVLEANAFTFASKKVGGAASATVGRSVYFFDYTLMRDAVDQKAGDPQVTLAAKDFKKVVDKCKDGKNWKIAGVKVGFDVCGEGIVGLNTSADHSLVAGDEYGPDNATYSGRYGLHVEPYAELDAIPTATADACVWIGPYCAGVSGKLQGTLLLARFSVRDPYHDEPAPVAIDYAFTGDTRVESNATTAGSLQFDTLSGKVTGKLKAAGVTLYSGTVASWSGYSKKLFKIWEKNSGWDGIGD